MLAAAEHAHDAQYPHEQTSNWVDHSTGTPLPGLSITTPPTDFLLFMGWVALVCGVVAMSSIGPLAASFRSVNGVLTSRDEVPK